MQLQAGYRYGLEPNEFEASLTRKVNKLFKFHGISNIETSVKEGAIKTVRRQVCVQRRGRHYIRLLDDEAMSELNLHSPRYLQSYHSPVKDESEWKTKRHIKQHELLTDALRDKFELVCKKSGLLNVSSHAGFLSLGGRSLGRLEFCNLIDLLTAEIIKDLSRLKRENWNTGRPTENFKKVFYLCEDILLDRYTAQQVAINDLKDEEHYRVWEAHDMVMISFAALMTAAEMTSNEVKKHPVQNDPLLIMLALGFGLASKLSPNPGDCVIIILSGMLLYAVSH
ncbi:uncharacterized protein LOC122948371 isoform X1 [Acropora millepora]|uniref:uncharacterized protein LOC122948371 isoform X1 n=1 Tax=Acropora millepora TaxID=45264 RepID=UPI001CF55352|nr:uncharacterized protein LOC122948371 isoform X1 [Acropora millepora]